MTTRTRRYAVLYTGWILLCALLFLGLRGAEDRSRRSGRILSNEAADRAVAILHRRDARRYTRFEAVHVAYAGRGEGGPQARWIVLCDRVPHTALHDAVVVELRAEDGGLIGVRAPVRR